MRDLKVFKLAGVLAFAVALCLALVGCGGSGGATGNEDATGAGAEAESVDNAKNFIGTWELEYSEGGNNPISAEDVESAKSVGLIIQLILNEDKTGSLDLMEEKLDAQWEANSATEGTLTIQEKSVTMTLDGNKLVLDLAGDMLHLVKVEQ